ncbi:exonuclease domain-containing protein [Foetidibacter luteolus]|uniref:exonuclease domain-containing protein n=1 Tax=Foetidibacter luteolus TaxID=2608880 RepID=UPI00129A3800|nr:exonuclease domain-containing protein [Foetidibacter luteolus]
MYAIVDIETTGSHAHNNGITEIAIVLHDGQAIEGRYETLVNPGVPIPPYVSHLTGITNNMVATAPPFTEVAGNIFRLLNGRIFIAHNVNFDYSFIKYHLRVSGYEWNPRKLCTLRLSRKAFPGFQRYGLGHICRELQIEVENRHRAGGDAGATAILFEKIVAKGGDKLIKDSLKRENREQILPPNLSPQDVNNLPYVPGVYYFKDAKDKVIYVGKAINLKKRVVSHFTGLNTGLKRQEFLRNIHSITYKECPTELTACILESIEIKRLWPAYNVSQKNFQNRYGIYSFKDAKGYLRLAIDKKRKLFEPELSFAVLTDAYRTMWKLVKEFSLHPALCFLDKSAVVEEELKAELYNLRVEQALRELKKQGGTYAIFEDCDFFNETSCILVEKGKFYGMGLLPENVNPYHVEGIKTYLTQYPENEVIQTLIRSYKERVPAAVINLDDV